MPEHRNLMGRKDAVECAVCHVAEKPSPNEVTPGVYVDGVFYCADDVPEAHGGKKHAPDRDLVSPSPIGAVATGPGPVGPPVKKPPRKPRLPKGPGKPKSRASR